MKTDAEFEAAVRITAKRKLLLKKKSFRGIISAVAVCAVFCLIVAVFPVKTAPSTNSQFDNAATNEAVEEGVYSKETLKSIDLTNIGKREVLIIFAVLICIVFSVLYPVYIRKDGH